MCPLDVAGNHGFASETEPTQTLKIPGESIPSHRHLSNVYYHAPENSASFRDFAWLFDSFQASMMVKRQLHVAYISFPPTTSRVPPNNSAILDLIMPCMVLA